MLTRTELQRHATGPARLSPLTFEPTEEEAHLISVACRAVDQVHRFATMPGDPLDDADEVSTMPRPHMIGPHLGLLAPARLVAD
jgi:hypothetical protein